MYARVQKPSYAYSNHLVFKYLMKGHSFAVRVTLNCLESYIYIQKLTE